MLPDIRYCRINPPDKHFGMELDEMVPIMRSKLEGAANEYTQEESIPFKNLAGKLLKSMNGEKSHELRGVYGYSAKTNSGISGDHGVQTNCVLKVADGFCFDARILWPIVFPSNSDKIIATATRKSNEVVYTKAKVITEPGVMKNCISKHLLILATVTFKVCAQTTAYFHLLCVLGKNVVAVTWLRIQLKHLCLFYDPWKDWGDLVRRNIIWENLETAFILWDPWGQGSPLAGGNVMARISSWLGKKRDQGLAVKEEERNTVFWDSVITGAKIFSTKEEALGFVIGLKESIYYGAVTNG